MSNNGLNILVSPLVLNIEINHRKHILKLYRWHKDQLQKSPSPSSLKNSHLVKESEIRLIRKTTITFDVVRVLASPTISLIKVICRQEWNKIRIEGAFVEQFVLNFSFLWIPSIEIKGSFLCESKNTIDNHTECNIPERSLICVKEKKHLIIDGLHAESLMENKKFKNQPINEIFKYGILYISHFNLILLISSIGTL